MAKVKWRLAPHLEKREVMNLGKADRVMYMYKLDKIAKMIVVGNEECILIDCDEEYIEKLQRKKLPINGHFSKKGFVMCNLNNFN